MKRERLTQQFFTTWILRPVPLPRTDVDTQTVFICISHSPDAVVCPTVTDEDVSTPPIDVSSLGRAMARSPLHCIPRLVPPLLPPSSPTSCLRCAVCAAPHLVCIPLRLQLPRHSLSVAHLAWRPAARPPASLGHVLCPALQQKQPQKAADRRAISAAQPADLAFDSCSPSPVGHHSWPPKAPLQPPSLRGLLLTSDDSSSSLRGPSSHI